MSDRVFGEPVAPDFEHVMRGRLLYEEDSSFQHLEVWDHAHFGRVLVLDGFVQTTTTDEFCYHEMLVHPALASRERVQRVLIIGGGDGGTLRRVLEHGPREAVLCEIDEAVTRVSRELMPEVSAGALDDPRATLVFSDGAAYVREAPAESFDAIVVDSTDPIGPAVVLFSVEFYEACRRALGPGGILVAQTGSPLVQQRELAMAVGNMREAFGSVEVHCAAVLHYPGVLWSFASATRDAPASAVDPETIRERLSERGIETRYYTPELHAAAFALPAFVRDLVDGAVAVR